MFDKPTGFYCIFEFKKSERKSGKDPCFELQYLLSKAFIIS